MVAQKKKERWVLGSLLLNGSLTILKFIFAVITGSLALMAEAIHSLSDLVASVISFISVKLSAKKTKDFPYGLYKLENIASIVIAFFLFFAAYEILKEAFFKHEEHQIQNPQMAIFVMLVAMISTFIYSRLEMKAAKDLNSPTLLADAHHIWADFLSSLIVLIGLISIYFGYNLDKYAAAIVSLFIFYSGFDILKNGIKVLLDVSIPEEEINFIKNIIYKNPAVVEIKQIKGREAGSHKFLEIELLLHNYGLRETHKIVDEIEKEIREKIPNIDSIFIHYEPVRQEGLRLAVLTDEDGKVKDFETAKSIIPVDITKDLKIRKNPPIFTENIGEILSNMNLDVIISKNHPADFNLRWNIAKAGILVWETEEEDLDKAIEEVINSYKKFLKEK